MSLIQCPECSSEVSSNALMCVRCGFPITKSKALSVAILLQDTQMIADLIQMGADINLADEHGMTPLKIAEEIGDPEIMKIVSEPPPVVLHTDPPAPVVESIEEPAPDLHSADVPAEVLPADDAPTLIISNVDVPGEVLTNTEAPAAVLSNTDVPAEVLPSIDAPGRRRSIHAAERSAKKSNKRKARSPRMEKPEQRAEIEPPRSPAKPTSDRPRKMISFLEDEDSPKPNQQSQKSSGLNCLSCGGSIKPDEMSCSHCKTLIMRRYCSGCSQLIPDHASICPLCGKNVKEHFLYAKLRRAKFFIGVFIFAIFGILFFVLLWPQLFSQATLLQADATKRTEPSLPVATAPEPELSEEEVNLPEPEQAPEEITLLKPEPQEERKPDVRKPIAQIPTETKTEPTREEPIVAQASEVEVTHPNPTMSASTQRALVLNARQRIKRGRFLNNRGFSLIKEGRPSEAIPLLEQSVRSFPEGTRDVTYAYALFNLAVAYRMSGRPDVAIPILEERIKINNQRDVVQRELLVAKRQVRESIPTTNE